jgi:transposase
MSAKSYIYKKLYGSTKTPIPCDILTYEIKTFFDNLSSCFSNLRNQNIKKFKMTHKNIKKQQTITIAKNCIARNGIYTRHLGKIENFVDSVNCTKFVCDCKLTYEKSSSNFYLFIPTYVQDNCVLKKRPICAIDPGEETPFTYYSLDDYGSIGKDIRKPILKIEQKIRKCQRIKAKGTNKQGDRINKKKIDAKINRLYAKIKGIVNELHKKAALFLCRNYDKILIPTFGTQNMISDKAKIKEKVKENYDKIRAENNGDPKELKTKLKEYKRKRRLNSRVKFVLQQLSHYKFKQHLFSKAKEYGCSCIEVTEEYTSQLCTMCGKLSKTCIGRTKKCDNCHSEINRDVNGARNILLKNYVPKKEKE